MNQDNTYHERLNYIDRNNQIENRNGHYTVEEDMLVLYPDKGDKEYYRIEENQLRKLNDQAQPVTGLLEDRYVLTKKIN
ncbi:MAG: copper resistance protein NlpE [Tannerellaceae bacterium]|nr:copper resistance protein NlpE [Tannerellaceae bacterium]